MAPAPAPGAHTQGARQQLVSVSLIDCMGVCVSVRVRHASEGRRGEEASDCLEREREREEQSNRRGSQRMHARRDARCPCISLSRSHRPTRVATASPSLSLDPSLAFFFSHLIASSSSLALPSTLYGNKRDAMGQVKQTGPVIKARAEAALMHEESKRGRERMERSNSWATMTDCVCRLRSPAHICALASPLGL